MKKRFSFIGAGNMATAIIEGIGMPVCVYDKSGKDIRFAITKNSYNALSTYGKEKSNEVSAFLNKVSV